MLYDSGAVKPDRIKDAEDSAKGLGKNKIDFAFIMDTFQEEREGGITIDIMHTPFESKKRSYMFIDCPGHREFIKNMITGASHADAALLLVSAKKGEGIQNQTKEHAWLAKILGIDQIIVVINKMDATGYDERVYNKISDSVKEMLGNIGYDGNKIQFIPVSAMEGDNVYKKSDKMPWYSGPILIDAMDNGVNPPKKPIEKPLRIVIQDVYDIGKNKIIVGRVETGTVKVDDEIVFQPSRAAGKIKSIKLIDKDVNAARAGESVGFEISGDIDIVKRGDVASHTDNLPKVVNGFLAKIYIMQPFTINVGDVVDVRCGTAAVDCKVKNIIDRVDPTSGDVKEKNPRYVKNGDAATLELVSDRRLAVERQADIPELGRFVIQSEGLTVAGGIIVDLK